MKQSTKLLSMLLALVLAFSCLSVIGSAALQKGDIKYDSIDDADLTYEQVATLALDLVDNDLLADMDTVDLSIVGELRLNKIDYLLADIHSLRNGFVWAIGKGLLGDIGDLDFSGLTQNDANSTALQRSMGDYNVVSGLLLFLAENAGTLSKVAYGLNGGDGISLGLVSMFLDLGDVGDMLNDIPNMLLEMVFDLLVYGSYGYDMDVDDIKAAKTTIKAKYPEMSTFDQMLPNVLYNLLTKPQDYTWEGDVKVWDMDSVIMPNLKLSASDINPLSHSLFEILDTAAQIAIDEIGIPALNNNLKKALMKAVEADLNEIDYETLPAAVKTYFDDTDAYETYFAYDRIKKDGGIWYYTTLETEVERDATGAPKLDEEGNEISSKVRKYFKVNMGAANEFASLINWDWEILPAGATVTDPVNQVVLDYEEIKGVNGTLVGGINKLIGIVYDVALTPAAKADFIAKVQEIDESNTTGWLNENGNDDLTTNVANLTKYILVTFGDKVFGSDSKFANYTWDEVKELTVIDLVAMIGPEFFEDAMPQIILPKNEDGTYAFHEGVQLWEFAAIVLRELITGIAPGVNYDHVIFENGDVTSEDDRLLAEHTPDEWLDILLNMGTDLGLTYLGQITNFKDYCAEAFGADFNLDDYVNGGIADGDADHWQTSLDHAILWAAKYVGGAVPNSGVINGLSYDEIAAVEGPINKLSYILNTILPLGFIGDGTYTSEEYALDLNLLVDGIKDLLTNFNLNTILHLFGRNEAAYNFLKDASLGTAVLDLVNKILYLVFGANILQGVNATGSVTAQSIDNVISKASLKVTVQTLFTALNNRKDAIVKNALPIVGKLMSGWGTEQEFQSPVHNVPTHINVEDTGCSYWYETEEDCKGNKSYKIQDKAALSYTVRNGSDGMWRHYVKDGVEYQDEHYAIQLESVEFFNYDGSASSYIHSINVDKAKVGYGGSASFNFKVGSIQTPDNQTRGSGSAVPESGVMQRVKIGYKIYVEDGSALLNGKVFYDESYVWLSRGANDERTNYETSSDAYGAHVFSPIYVPYYEDDIDSTLAYIKAANIGQFDRSNVAITGGTEDYKITVASTPDTDGLTMSSVSARIPNGDHDSVMIRLFDTYTAQVMKSGAVSTTFAVNGAVPTADVFKQNVTMAEVDSAAGASSSWTVNLMAKSGKNEWDGVGVTLKYYNAEYRDLLIDLVNDENNAQRKASDYKHYYNASATVEASEALINVDVPASSSESGKFELRQTNFAVGPNGVTVINCAQAWNNYYTALKNALDVGLQEWTPASKFNFREVYNALRVAVNDIEYCTATVDDGAASLGTTVDALEDQLRASQARQTDIYNHTDYEMYRHNRYNDARDDANGYIVLKDEASPANVTYIDEYFDYSWMEEDDFRELVGQHAIKYGEHAGQTVAANKYQAYLLALLEKYNEEEIAGKKDWLNNRKKDFANISELDLAMASNYLTLTEDRLIRRTHGVITKQLDDEIASAENMIGTTNDGTYTAGSWANYINAYDNAVDAQDSGSQKQIFDAKYQLLVQRKALVKVEDAGDYNELNALIANAQFALANPNLYDNTDKEFGQVLAELGMDKIENSDGNMVELFPGSALNTVAAAYGADDQDKIDDAAWVLKEALARLKFKGLEVEDTTTGKIVESEVLVEANEEEGIEEISALISHISKETSEDDAKALFRVVASNLTSVTVDDIIVTNDANFSVNYEGMDEFIGFAGTNSTITFYTTANGVKLPVATVKVVVDGDINGDGVIDALDASYAALIASEKDSLEGCYLLAGDVTDNDRALTANDYGRIVNMAADLV